MPAQFLPRIQNQEAEPLSAAMSGVEVSKKTQDEEEDELTLCVVDCVGRQSRVSSNAVVGRKPRWDRPTRSGGSHKGGWGKKVG